MSFLCPAALWLLLALPIAALGYALLLRRRRPAGRHPLLAELRLAMTGVSMRRRHLPALLILAGCGACIVASARPVIVRTLVAGQRTIMLAMDISASMKATDVLPDRISAARVAAKAFIASMPDDTRIGLVAYAGDAHLLSPPTGKQQDLRDAMDGVQLQVGTAIGSGLLIALMALCPEHSEEIKGALNHPFDAKRAVERRAVASASRRSEPPGAIVLFSDGANTEGIDPLDAARLAADLSVPVFTVGIGTDRDEYVTADDGMQIYVKLDERTLRDIAERTHGRYFAAQSAEEITRVYRRIASRLRRQERRTEITALAAGLAALLFLGGGALSMWQWRAVA